MDKKYISVIMTIVLGIFFVSFVAAQEEGAVQKLGSIAGGLIWNIVYAIGVVAFAAGLYYLVRWIQKGTKKQKAFTITAIILDLNGVIDFDMLAFVKSEESGLLEMIFQNRKNDSIPPIPKHLIKNNHTLLLNYAPGHYCIIDTSSTIWNFNNGKWEIVPYNLGMKKYITSKQREIMNKVEARKQKWETRGPWIALGIGVVSAVLFAAFLFYVGSKQEAANIAARVAECMGVR